MSLRLTRQSLNVKVGVSNRNSCHYVIDPAAGHRSSERVRLGFQSYWPMRKMNVSDGRRESQMPCGSVAAPRMRKSGLQAGFALADLIRDWYSPCHGGPYKSEDEGSRG